MNIMYSCNDTYVPQTVVSLVSLFENNKHTDITIYLVTDQIQAINIKKISEIIMQYGGSMREYSIKDVIPENLIDDANRHPKTIYAKLFMEKFIDQDRFLYLDSDTIVDASIEEMYHHEMKGKVIAGVRMPYSENLRENMNILGGDYICDGIVLFNLKLWREEQKEKECIKYIKRNYGMPKMLSEETLNYVCQNEIDILPPSYNVMPHLLFFKEIHIKSIFQADHYYHIQEISAAKQAPIIIHFLNELYDRPWNKGCKHPYAAKYQTYYESAFQKRLVKSAGTIGKKTKITKFAYHLLPFQIFLKLYHSLRHEFI